MTKKYWKIFGLLCAITFAPMALAAVNVNTADATTIAKELNGVGIKKAEAIVEYRKQHGPFTSLEQLEQVKGIGHALVEKNKDNIKLK